MDDWRRMGELIDRVLVVVFLMVVVFGSVAIFLSVPHIIESIDEEDVKRTYSVNLA